MHSGYMLSTVNRVITRVGVGGVADENGTGELALKTRVEGSAMARPRMDTGGV